jgi:hypothetical protein
MKLQSKEHVPGVEEAMTQLKTVCRDGAGRTPVADADEPSSVGPRFDNDSMYLINPRLGLLHRSPSNRLAKLR